MLQSLHVHNFALLEDAKVEFAPGFNVFTGETGAWKIPYRHPAQP